MLSERTAAESAQPLRDYDLSISQHAPHHLSGIEVNEY